MSAEKEFGGAARLHATVAPEVGMTLFALTLFAATPAFAAGDPNTEFSFGLGLIYSPHTRVHHPGATGQLPGKNLGHWGVELLATHRAAVADHCGYAERACWEAPIWPIVGPTASLTWRGGDSLGYSVGIIAGGASLAMYDQGFFPLWEAVGEVGWSQELGGGSGLLLGVYGGRSLSFRQPIGENGYQTIGSEPLVLRFGHVWRWNPADGWFDGNYRLRVEASTSATEYN